MTNSDVGKMIRLRRQAAGLSARQLGEMVGKDERSIRAYEDGGVDVKLSTLLKIAEKLGTNLADLVSGAARPKKHYTEIRIYQLEDRMNVASILVKNGYTVSQVKRSNGDGKNVQYRLKLEESEDNIRVVR